MREMSKPRTWADALEIKAFANKFEVNVRVWRDGSEAVFLTNKNARNQRTLNVVYYVSHSASSLFELLLMSNRAGNITTLSPQPPAKVSGPFWRGTMS